MSLKNAEFLDIFMFMSILNFMLNLVEHKKSCITSGLEFSLTRNGLNDLNILENINA